MTQADICIVGAGVIGLSLALELEARGAKVTVIERGAAMLACSQAAAGMLAAHDPENPPALLALSELSVRAYADFLQRVEGLSGLPVPFQTGVTFQAVRRAAGHEVTDALPTWLRAAGMPFVRLAEHSIDPRQLGPALAAAAGNTSICVMNQTTMRDVTRSARGVSLDTSAGRVCAGQIVHALGAWSVAPVVPKKGQMLSVAVPDGLALDAVVRTPEVYIVPRLRGPRAGQVVIGATVEDAGFSTGTDEASLRELRRLATELVPELGDERTCPMTACWAGHRPHTPDHLPMLGILASGANGLPLEVIATGHYRNGILLAPGTAKVMADVLEGKQPGIRLDAFAPGRFAEAGEKRTTPPIFAQLP